MNIKKDISHSQPLPRKAIHEVHEHLHYTTPALAGGARERSAVPV
jgi:hypothetical protein